MTKIPKTFITRLRDIIIIYNILLGTSVFSQSELENKLSKALYHKDSSSIYFKEAYNKLITKSDSASYFYFKLFKKNNDNQSDSVIYYANKVIPLYKKLDSLYRLRKIYERLYFTHLNNGNYDKALIPIQNALKVANILNDTANVSLHYADISTLHHDFNFFEKGVKYGKKAYKVMDEASHKQIEFLIIANNAIAINFDDWNKPDSALYYHYKNITLLKKVKDTLKYAFVYNNIANTNLKQGNHTTAKKFLKKALAISTLIGTDYSLATNYTNLGTIASEENKNNKAKDYLKKALSYAKKSNSIEKLRDVLLQEHYFYKKNKNYKIAIEKQDAYYKLKDSVFNSTRATKFAQLEVKYRTAEKEKEIAQQKEALLAQELEIKNKSLYATLLVALLLTTAIIFFSVYKRNQLKRKQLQKEIDLKDALTIIKTQNRLQEQRLQISRDLHDNIGSQLTFIISSIDNLKYISNDANEKLKAKLANISSFTGDTIHQLRDTIWAMNKNEITIDDLHSRILSFVEKAKEAVPQITFNIDFNVDKDIRFSSLVGMNIFRAIQEALNNAIKHSDGNFITISITKKNNQLVVSVIDNGIGFDLKNINLGNGLSNIEKRMSEINGTAHITSNINIGTNINLSVTTDNTTKNE